MLCLSRQVGERILIADEIEVEVLEIHGRRVKLGVTAPREYRISRGNAKDVEEESSK